MITEYEQVSKTGEQYDQPDVNRAADLTGMTPETARRLAAVLAPHLVAMRAVTVGTSYADSGGNGSDDVLGGVPASCVSPAVNIFIAGMLQRISG